MAATPDYFKHRVITADADAYLSACCSSAQKYRALALMLLFACCSCAKVQGASTDTVADCLLLLLKSAGCWH